MFKREHSRMDKKVGQTSVPLASSLQTFAYPKWWPLLDVKLVWEGGKAEFYELAELHQN